MSTLADSLVASSARTLPMRVRPDLTVKQQRYQGQSYWVIKEPVGLKYFRFQAEEYAILKMLNGKISLEEIKERFESEFAPLKIEYAELQQFIGMLHRSGLVITNAPGQGKQLRKRRDEKKRKELLAQLSNVLAIRFKGIDPERLLNWLYPKVRWLFSPLVFFAWCLLIITALSLLATHFDVFYSRLPAFHEFFGPKNWLYLGVILAATKILHEFGHGLLCKHYGGECHEMGVMILVLTPCLYCNVSDSWMLPNKWQRAAIGAGGIYIEIGLASLATILWWFAEPTGLLSQLSLRVMFICSVSTILFNGNPLLRFDGYYILADIMEIPNLRQKASAILNRILGQWCLGLEPPEDPFLPQKNLFMFALYSIAAVCYRWVITISILLFLNEVFEPYGLKIIGQLIAGMGVFGLLIMPLWKLWKYMSTPGRIDQVKKPRFYATVGVITTVILVVALVPFPHYVKCSLEIRARDEASVYVSVPGKLDKLADGIKTGITIEEGQVLAILSNVDLQMELNSLQSERSQFQTQLNGLRRQAYENHELAHDMPRITEEIKRIDQQIAEKQRDVDRLQIIAPVAGTIMPVASRPSRSSNGMLPEWSGTAMHPKNCGAHLTERDMLCQIGNPNQLEAILFIDQGDIEMVEKDQDVQLKLDVLAWETLEGNIDKISGSKVEVTPSSLSNLQGGDLATKTDSETGQQRPLSTKYQARVPLDKEDLPNGIYLGMRGRAKIATEWQSLGSRVWRIMITTFNFKL